MPQIYFLRRSQKRTKQGITRLTKVHCEVIKKHGTKCHYCGDRDFDAFDHIVPKCLGGGNRADNLVPTCKSCNSAKGSKPYDEFMELMYAEKAAFWTYCEFQE